MSDVIEASAPSTAQSVLMSILRVPEPQPRPSAAAPVSASDPVMVQHAAPVLRIYEDPRLATRHAYGRSAHGAQAGLLKAAISAAEGQRHDIEQFIKDINRFAARDTHVHRALPTPGFVEGLHPKRNDGLFSTPRSTQDHTKLLRRFEEAGLMAASPARKLRQLYDDANDLALKANRTLVALNARAETSPMTAAERGQDSTIRAMVADRYKGQIEDAVTRYTNEAKLTDLFDFQDLVRRIDVQRLLDKAEMMVLMRNQEAVLRIVEAKLSDPVWQSPDQRPRDATASLAALTQYSEA